MGVLEGTDGERMERILKLLRSAGTTFWRSLSRAFDGLWPAQAAGRLSPGEVAWWQPGGRTLFFLVLLVGFPIAVNRSLYNGGTDFPDFYRSARYVLEQGTRSPNSEFLRYLPSADVPWIAIAILPLPLAAAVNYLICCWSWIGLLDTTGRSLLTKLDSADRRQTMLLVGLFVLPIAVNGFCVGAFHVLMVWCMVAGLTRAARGENWRAGLFLGLAIWIKLLPGLGAAYLLLKRRWQPALISLGFVVVFDIVLSLVAYGPKVAWDEHRTWWQNEGQGALGRQLEEPGGINEDRLTNQSIPVILRRTLSGFGEVPYLERDAVMFADLSGRQLRLVYYGVIGVLGLAGAWFFRRSYRNTSPSRWSIEIAMVLLGTIWFSPVVWGYHPTSVVPALAILLGAAAVHPRLARCAASLWLVALMLFTSHIARAFGQVTLATLAFGGMLVWLATREESSEGHGIAEG